MKALTEGLAHSLRESAGDRVTAHLLIPGFTYTGMTSPRPEKPAGAWTPEQVIGFMLERLACGDFYILCPDGEVDRPTDEKRILWAAQDIVQNRPPLSRWHTEYSAAFTSFLKN